MSALKTGLRYFGAVLVTLLGPTIALESAFLVIRATGEPEVVGPVVLAPILIACLLVGVMGLFKLVRQRKYRIVAVLLYTPVMAVYLFFLSLAASCVFFTQFNQCM
jgi:hypothetical protein